MSSLLWRLLVICLILGIAYGGVPSQHRRKRDGESSQHEHTDPDVFLSSFLSGIQEKDTALPDPTVKVSPYTTVSDPVPVPSAPSYPGYPAYTKNVQEIQPRTDIITSFGTIASSIFPMMAHALGKFLGFLFNKKMFIAAAGAAFLVTGGISWRMNQDLQEVVDVVEAENRIERKGDIDPAEQAKVIEDTVVSALKGNAYGLEAMLGETFKTAVKFATGVDISETKTTSSASQEDKNEDATSSDSTVPTTESVGQSLPELTKPDSLMSSTSSILTTTINEEQEGTKTISRKSDTTDQEVANNDVIRKEEVLNQEAVIINEDNLSKGDDMDTDLDKVEVSYPEQIGKEEVLNQEAVIINEDNLLLSLKKEIPTEEQLRVSKGDDMNTDKVEVSYPEVVQEKDVAKIATPEEISSWLSETMTSSEESELIPSAQHQNLSDFDWLSEASSGSETFALEDENKPKLESDPVVSRLLSKNVDSDNEENIRRESNTNDFEDENIVMVTDGYKDLLATFRSVGIDLEFEIVEPTTVQPWHASFTADVDNQEN